MSPASPRLTTLGQPPKGPGAKTGVGSGGAAPRSSSRADWGTPRPDRVAQLSPRRTWLSICVEQRLRSSTVSGRWPPSLHRGIIAPSGTDRKGIPAEQRAVLGAAQHALVACSGSSIESPHAMRSGTVPPIIDVHCHLLHADAVELDTFVSAYCNGVPHLSEIPRELTDFLGSILRRFTLRDAPPAAKPGPPVGGTARSPVFSSPRGRRVFRPARQASALLGSPPGAGPGFRSHPLDADLAHGQGLRRSS